MAPDDGDRRPRRDDARPFVQTLLDRAAHGEHRLRRGAEVAHRRHSGVERQARILERNRHGIFVGIQKTLIEGVVMIAGKMDMRVDEAGQDGLVAKVDDPRPGGRRDVTLLDAGDASIGDDQIVAGPRARSEASAISRPAWIATVSAAAETAHTGA